MELAPSTLRSPPRRVSCASCVPQRGLENSDAGVRRAVVQTLRKLEPATLAQHGAALVAKLEDSDAGVRRAVVQTLGQLEPATLAQHGAALVARLEDSDAGVRRAVVEMLGMLEPGTLAQHGAKSPPVYGGPLTSPFSYVSTTTSLMERELP